MVEGECEGSFNAGAHQIDNEPTEPGDSQGGGLPARSSNPWIEFQSSKVNSHGTETG